MGKTEKTEVGIEVGEGVKKNPTKVSPYLCGILFNSFPNFTSDTRLLLLLKMIYRTKRSWDKQSIPYKGCSRGPKLGTYSDWGFSSVLVINKHLSHHHQATHTPEVGLGIYRTREKSSESSLQRILSIFLLWKRNDLLVVAKREPLHNGDFWKNRVSPAEKIEIRHCASVLFSQVPKKCTELDLNILYILTSGIYSKFARKRNFPALCVCFSQPCSSAGRRFATSRSRLQYYQRIVSGRLRHNQLLGLYHMKSQIECVLLFLIKMGLGIYQTNVDSQWNSVYNAFYRFFCYGNKYAGSLWRVKKLWATS